MLKTLCEKGPFDLKAKFTAEGTEELSGLEAEAEITFAKEAEVHFSGRASELGHAGIGLARDDRRNITRRLSTFLAAQADDEPAVTQEPHFGYPVDVSAFERIAQEQLDLAIVEEEVRQVLAETC